MKLDTESTPGYSCHSCEQDEKDGHGEGCPYVEFLNPPEQLAGQIARAEANITDVIRFQDQEQWEEFHEDLL